MEQVTRIGMDTSKRVFQVHGVDAGERPVLRRQLRRDAMMSFFTKHPPGVWRLRRAGRLITGRGCWERWGTRCA